MKSSVLVLCKNTFQQQVAEKSELSLHMKVTCTYFCVQVFLDGAIVPGWEGKIVAWVEEDRGDKR